MKTHLRGPRAAVVAACAAASFASLAPAGGFIDPGVTALWAVTDPDGVGGLFGWGVADIDDLDGDGVRDVVTAAPLIGTAGMEFGRAYVLSGRTGAIIHRWILDVPSRFGFSAVSAGDVDLDGVADVLVGAPIFGGRGRVYVYSGATGAELRTIDGQAANDQFGYFLAGIGDINGDLAADFVVGAITHDTGATNAGRVYVYSGGTGALIRTHDGSSVGSLLGSGVGAAGDVNRDGIGDYIAGARGGPAADRGRAFVWSGADGSPLLPMLLPDQSTGVDFGWFFVSGVGDVNRDGTPDLYVGDFNDSNFTGKSYVFSGVDGSNLYTFTPPSTGDGMGPGRYAGDLNDDGHADLAVGVYTSSLGAPTAGRVFIYSGRDGVLLRSVSSTTAGESFGFDTIGLGDADGDCAVDILVSAASGNSVYLIKGDFPTLRGDSNNDLVVTFADVTETLVNIGASYLPVTGAGDADRDGDVDFEDVTRVLTRFGAVCP